MLVRVRSGRQRRLRSSVAGAETKGEGTMTEATGGSRAEMERKLIQRSLEDEDFRQRLLDDPRGTIEQELETRLPEGVEVRVVEESAQTIYLVLPSTSPLGQGEELSDQELEAVAGGGSEWGTCGCTDPNVNPDCGTVHGPC
jgi:hypothetical protein